MESARGFEAPTREIQRASRAEAARRALERQQLAASRVSCSHATLRLSRHGFVFKRHGLLVLATSDLYDVAVHSSAIYLSMHYGYVHLSIYLCLWYSSMSWSIKQV